MTEPRCRRIVIRVTEEERRSIERRSQGSGLTVSSFVRSRALGDRTQPQPEIDIEAIRAILIEMKRQGNNLNQIARTLNRGRNAAASLDELDSALKSVAAAADNAAKLLALVRK